MAEVGRNLVFDNLPSGNSGINTGTTGSLHDTAFGTSGWQATDDEHWRTQYASRPYVQADRSYDYYAPAYRYGTESAHQHANRSWDDAQSDLERGWDSARGTSTSAWAEVKDAARDAWDRVRGR